MSSRTHFGSAAPEVGQPGATGLMAPFLSIPYRDDGQVRRFLVRYQGARLAQA